MGFLGSDEGSFNSGVIIPYSQASGMVPVSKQTQNSLCKKPMHVSDWIISAGILSYPGDLFLFSDMTDFRTSTTDMPPSSMTHA